MTSVDKAMCGGIIVAFLAGVIAGRMPQGAPKASEVKTTTSTSVTSTLVASETSRDMVRKDIVTTITKKPDGTRVTVVQDHSVDSEHSSEKMSQSTATHSTNTTDSVVYAPTRPTWSLGLTYSPIYAISPLPYNPKAFTPSAGYRVAGGLWVEAAFVIGSATPTIGLRLEF